MKVKVVQAVKLRAHHNRTGAQQSKAGKTFRDLKRIAKKLGIPLKPKPH